MPEDVSTSATLTASDNFVHSNVGPASNAQPVSSAGSASAGTAGGGGGSPTLPTTGWQWPVVG